MSNPLIQTIEALAKEKGIEPDVVIGAIEDAVLTASRKYYKTNENLKTRFNQDTGQVDLFAVKQIVQEVTNPATEISLLEAQQLYGEEAEVDMEIEFPKPTDVLGRIAAQTAKQVIFQKVREAERENIFAEYSGSSASRTATSSSRSAASRRCCRARSSRGPKATPRPTASAP